jgi:predicted nucleic acid-binding protein
MTRKERYYIDTSVIGGCLDTEFKRASRKLLDLFVAGERMALISDITVAEVHQAPREVRRLLEDISSDHVERVELDGESNALSASYVEGRVIPRRFLADAQHIAIATVSRADLVVSWNFKHIVNLERIRGFNSVNVKLGYRALEVRSPWEVVGRD